MVDGKELYAQSSGRIKKGTYTKAAKVHQQALQLSEEEFLIVTSYLKKLMLVNFHPVCQQPDILFLCFPVISSALITELNYSMTNIQD